MASSECCEVPGRAWPRLCWEGQGGHTLILNPLIHTGQHGVVLSITVSIFPVLGSGVRANFFSFWLFLFSSGCWQWGNPLQCGALAIVTMPGWPVFCLPRDSRKQGTFLSLWLLPCCVEAALEVRLIQGILWIPLIALELSLAKYGKPSSNCEAVETRSSNDGRCQNKLRLFLPFVRYRVPGCPSDLSSCPFRTQGRGRREMP